jgi:hypothetical protein
MAHIPVPEGVPGIVGPMMAYPETAKDRAPNITAQGRAWEAGYRLVDYQIVDDGKLDDANLRCAVKLALRDPQGRDVHKSVKYVVGTNPIITVFREVLP